MSTVEPIVAVANLLYNNWTATSPNKDIATAATQDPTKVHFTNRWYAYAPLRLHPFQITVRPLNKPYRALQLGTITKYHNPENMAVHVWILPNPQLTIEQAHTSLYNMLQEIRRIIRIQGETAGSGIQHILLGPWQDRSELDRDPPRLHVEARIIGQIFEMSTS
ncbi:MAG TPA: hypothetical protein VFE98_02935 [Candidatus Bathyarchaeia archaeon]|nr:hypothetical protein [Candidatus Bathyarchaeia archaeon]